MKKQKPPDTAKKIIIGVTGSFGSGKSTVSRMFKQLGARIIDADSIAHDSIAQGKKLYKTLIRRFGASIAGPRKDIDRKKLSRIVFCKKKNLRALNALMHPEIIRRIKGAVKSSHARVVVIDAPLLIETGLHKTAHKVVVVKASKKNQIEREKRKSGLSEADVLKRIKAQVSLSRKVRLADFIIDNSGTIKETRKQVREIWKSLTNPPADTQRAC